jgi:phage-related holin
LCSKCTDLGAPVFKNIKVLIDNFKNKFKDDDHVNRKTLRRD